jgi:DNA polymerase-4
MVRYSVVSTPTRAPTVDAPTQIDRVLLENVRALFRWKWQRGRPVRLLGVHAGTLQIREGQLNLIEGERYKKWGKALNAADRLRERFGESAVGLAAALRHGREERVHENPAGLPGHEPKKLDGT